MAVTKYYALDFAEVSASNEMDMRICAKQIIPEEDDEVQRIKYFIRFNELTGKAYDPTTNFVDVNTRGTQAKQNWIYRRVNESCFNNYLRFLGSRNQVWLQQAEREVINGFR